LFENGMEVTRAERYIYTCRLIAIHQNIRSSRNSAKRLLNVMAADDAVFSGLEMLIHYRN